jgi:hypothetical protein
MGARFSDFSLMQHQYFIGMLYGREPVRYHDSGAIPGEFGQSILYQQFRFRINI